MKKMTAAVVVALWLGGSSAFAQGFQMPTGTASIAGQVTAIDTARAPSSAAFLGSGSSRCLRSIDSSTTMALSTSIPTPSIRPIIERMLRLLPRE